MGTIAYATQKYPPEKYPNLTFVCMDARSLDLDQELIHVAMVGLEVYAREI